MAYLDEAQLEIVIMDQFRKFGYENIRGVHLILGPPLLQSNSLWQAGSEASECDGYGQIISQTEPYQLPAPLFETTDAHTRAVLFAHRELREMDKDDRIRACYLHACLKYVQRDFMANTTLRKRFGIESKNSAMASRIIKETSAANLIRPYDETASKKFMKYVPWWA